MNCHCPDQEHDTRTAMWHRAYCNWLNHRDHGQKVRAAAWGWLADRLVRFVR